MTDMTNELKPCEHCGGDVCLEQIDGMWCIDCPICERYHWEYAAPAKYAGKEGLIEWWNARYKRTCNICAPSYESMPYGYCSVCKAPWKHNDAKFCPNCGAEVTDAD